MPPFLAKAVEHLTNFLYNSSLKTQLKPMPHLLD